MVQVVDSLMLLQAMVMMQEMDKLQDTRILPSMISTSTVAVMLLSQSR